MPAMFPEYKNQTSWLLKTDETFRHWADRYQALSEQVQQMRAARCDAPEQSELKRQMAQLRAHMYTRLLRSIHAKR